MASGQLRPNTPRTPMEPPTTAARLTEAAHHQEVVRDRGLKSAGITTSSDSMAHEVARSRLRSAQGQRSQRLKQQEEAAASIIPESSPFVSAKKLVASRQQRDVAVKLARSQWPEQQKPTVQSSLAGERQRTKNNNANSSNSRETSSLRRVESLEPLIHTDKLDASSPTLTVITSAHHRQQQQVNSRLQQSTSPLDHQLAESAFPASRVGVLASSYSKQQQPQLYRRNNSLISTATMTSDSLSEQPPNSRSVSEQQRSESPTMESATTTTNDSVAKATTMVIVPRLVLLNLEISNSSATLTWDLQLVSPANEQQQLQKRQQRSSAPLIASSDPIGLAGTTTTNAQQPPTTTNSEQTDVNTSDDSGGPRKAASPRLIKHNGASVLSSTLPHWLQVAEKHQQQLPPIVVVRHLAEKPVIFDPAEHPSEPGGARLLVKRDTIRSQELGESGFGDASGGDANIYTLPEDGQEDKPTPSGPLLLLSTSSADQRDGSFSMETSSGADQMSDPLTTSGGGGDHSSLFTRRKAPIASSSSTSSTTAAPSIDVDPSEFEGGFGGGNIQLGRLQPLQASRNRRPPMRITQSSSTTSTTSVPTSTAPTTLAHTTENPVVQSHIRAAATASTLSPETTAPTSTPTPTATNSAPSASTSTTATATTTPPPAEPATSGRPTRKGGRRQPPTTKRPAAGEGGPSVNINDQQTTTTTGQEVAQELDGWERPKPARVHATWSSQSLSISEPAPAIRAPIVSLNRLSGKSTTTTSTQSPQNSTSSEVLSTTTEETPTTQTTATTSTFRIVPIERDRTTTTTTLEPTTIASTASGEPIGETSLPPATSAAARAGADKPVAPGGGAGGVRPERQPASSSSGGDFDTTAPSMIAASLDTTTTTGPITAKATSTASQTRAPSTAWLPPAILRSTDELRLSSLVAAPVDERPSNKPSVRLTEQPIAGNPISLTGQFESSPATVQGRDEETLTSVDSGGAPTASPTIGTPKTSVITTTTSEPDGESISGQAPSLADSSRWLVRLRRFGSNEVDIVKVIVNNLRQLFASNQMQQPQLNLRQISFTNLEPSSGYEICIESASENQQISDKFHIMDANHFLKCQDSTEVELGSSSVPIGVNSSSSAATDGRSRVESPRDDIERLPIALPLLTPATGNQNRNQEQQHGHSKMRSLCKEFFTLPLNSIERANWGLSALFPSPEIDQQIDQIPTTNSSRSSSLEAQLPNSAGSSSSQSANQQQARKPKSLHNNALKSRIEILEINDFHLPYSHRSWNIFELAASQRQNNGNNWNSRPSIAAAAPPRGLTQTASDSTYSTSHVQPSLLAGNWSGNEGSVGANASNSSSASSGNQRHATAAAAESYLVSSITPIVGCVFALIFIVTFANVLLNTISCRSSTMARRRRLARHHRRSICANSGTGILSGRTTAGGLAGLTGAAIHKHTLGSFYSDSDHSGGGDSSGQSRIIVIGKNSDPFALTSAYFEVPHDPLLAATNTTGGSSATGSRAERLNANELGSFDPMATTTGSVNGSAHDGAGSSNQRYASSAYLLSGAARFPLGPSFEGDERHNADMVGLARKNYNNFINNIYNSDPNPRGDSSSDRMQEFQFESPSQKRSTHRKIHHQHYHLRHHKHNGSNSRNQMEVPEEQQQRQHENHYQTETGSGGTNRQRQLQAQSSANGSQVNNGKRQRIRFDKINPIYNMEGLQYSLTGTNKSDRSGEQLRASNNNRANNRLKSYPNTAGGGGGLISFGHSNPALVAEERQADGEKQSNSACSSGEDMDEQCPYCRAELELSAQPGNDNAAGCDDDGCGCGENRDESLHFTCCLDRQQQRIHTQQQQLERVRSKNGSLVPQPFINPPEARQRNSDSSTSGSQEEQMISISSFTGPSGNGQDNGKSPPPPEEIMFGDSQPESTVAEAASLPPKNSSAQTVPAAGLSMTMPSTPTSNQLPSLPPPPPNFKTTPTSGGSSTGDGGDGKRLISVAASPSGASTDQAGGSGMDKTDFNQRRNELASKLRLAGMGKPAN